MVRFFFFNLGFVIIIYSNPLKGYDWKSGKYSTWTESTWDGISARIFLRPSRSHEALTLAIGFVVMTISFVLIFFLNSRSDILFGNSSTSVP